LLGSPDARTATGAANRRREPTPRAAEQQIALLCGVSSPPAEASATSPGQSRLGPLGYQGYLSSVESL